jgi:hypothetical protein
MVGTHRVLGHSSSLESFRFDNESTLSSNAASVDRLAANIMRCDEKIN